jgi:hypothetical protein
MGDFPLRSLHTDVAVTITVSVLGGNRPSRQKGFRPLFYFIAWTL